MEGMEREGEDEEGEESWVGEDTGIEFVRRGEGGRWR